MDDILDQLRTLARHAPNGSDLHLVHWSTFQYAVKEIERLRPLAAAAKDWAESFDVATDPLEVRSVIEWHLLCATRNLLETK